MKLNKKFLAAAMALVLAVTSLSLMAFADDEDYYRPSITGGRRTLRVGESTDLELRVRDDRGNTVSYSGSADWTSDNDRIASVDSSGTVTAHYPGTVSIRVQIDNGRGTSVGIVVSGSGGYYYDYDDYYWNDYYGYSYGWPYYRTNPYNPDSPMYNSSRSSSSSSSSTTVNSRDVIKLTETAPRETVLNRVRAADGGNVILQDYAAVSAETLQAAAALSSSRIHFDTMSGNTTVGRISFTAANASKYTGTIQTGVYVDTGNTASVSARFNKSFTNRTKIVLIDQRSFEAPVEISFRAGNLGEGNLYFYSYNESTNNYNSLTVSDAYKDESNYIHFTTTVGGYIIVSDGPLSLV